MAERVLFKFFGFNFKNHCEIWKYYYLYHNYIDLLKKDLLQI